MAVPLRVLVEHCTADRDEIAGVRLPRPSLSLKGDSASYTNRLEDLVGCLEAELPNVPVSANTSRLFDLQHESQARSFGHDYTPPQRPIRREPRLGAFEVFLELNVAGDALLIPLTSKLSSKKFPDVRRVVQLVSNAVVENMKHVALRTLEGSQSSFLQEVLHSTLHYQFSQEHDQTRAERPAILGTDQWAEALAAETWDMASHRDLQNLPQEMMKSRSWHLLHHTLCNLHFLGAKLRKCGHKAVLRDLEEAHSCIRTFTAGDPSADGKEDPVKATLLRQLNSDLGMCRRFVSKNASALCATATCIYTQAQRYSLPGLVPLKKRFAYIFQHMQLVAQATDDQDRESNGLELLKYAYGVSIMKSARRSGFFDCFSGTDQTWMSCCCQDLQARLTVQTPWIRQLLANDTNAVRIMFQLAEDDQILGHFAKARLFFFLAEALSGHDIASTMRLEFRAEDAIDAQQGFTAVHTVLNEIFMDQNIHSVEAHIMRDTEELRQPNLDSHVYAVNIGLAASASSPSLPPSKVESVLSFLKDILLGQGPELAAMLPNRTSLRYAGVERDVYLIVKLCLPTSMPCPAAENQRYAQMLQEDLIASSRFALDADSISVLELDRRGALVLIHESRMPAGASTTDVVQDFITQVESSDTSAAELLRPERLISLHIFWLSYTYTKPGQHIPIEAGLDTRALLLSFAESPDLVAERAVLSELVVPALSMQCKAQSINLTCLIFGGPAPDDTNHGGTIVGRWQALRAFKAERQSSDNTFVLGVVGNVQHLGVDADTQTVLQQLAESDCEHEWQWAQEGQCPEYSRAMLHLSTALSLNDPGAVSTQMLAMIRRQDFEGNEKSGSFLKEVPANARTVFEAPSKSTAAVQHIVSRIQEVVKKEHVLEYPVGYACFLEKNLVGRPLSDPARVSQNGIEAFALDVYQHLLRGLSACLPATTVSAYPWQLRELNLQEQGLRRHEESFFMEKDSQLQGVKDEIISIASSMEMTAPALVLLEGVSGSGRSALLAKVTASLAPDSGKRYVAYMCKRQGSSFGDSVAALTSNLWLQLVGGRHMHLKGNTSKWSLSDLFDVVQRASAHSCNDSSFSYRRVVLVLDGFSAEEQLAICEHLLSRPRLFPLVTCILATTLRSSAEGLHKDAREVSLHNRQRLVQAHLHTRVVSMPRLTETEALQVATNLLSLTHDNAEEMIKACKEDLVRKKEIWRPGYIRCLVNCMRGTGGTDTGEDRSGQAFPTHIIERLPHSRRQVFFRVLETLNRMHGVSKVGTLLCSLLSITGILDSELRMRTCQPKGKLRDSQYLAIINALQPFLVLEDFWRDGSLILTDEFWPDVVRRYVIPPLDGIHESTLNSLALQSVAELRQRQSLQKLHEHAEHYGDSFCGLLTELPGELGSKLTRYWANMEGLAVSNDKQRYAVWRSARHSRGSGSVNSSRISVSPNSSVLRSPPEASRSGDFSFLPPADQSVAHDQLIISKMMQEMMALSEKAFRNSPTGKDSNIRHQQGAFGEISRPASANVHERESPDLLRRPKSAGPALRYSGHQHVHKSSHEAAHPALKVRPAASKPHRLPENWVQMDLHSFPSRASPAHSPSGRPKTTSPSLQNRRRASTAGDNGETWLAARSTRTDASVGSDLRDGGLAEMADDLILDEARQSNAIHDANTSMREGLRSSKDAWQLQQIERRKRQAELTRQLAQACDVRRRQEGYTKRRLQVLAAQNEEVRFAQEQVHLREMKPFVPCKGKPPSPYRAEGHLKGRILYEPLEISNATKQERRLMRQVITRRARQRQHDLEDYLAHFRSSKATPDENERKEFERLVREAVESRDAFDAFVAQRENAKVELAHKQEAEQRREQRRLVLEQKAADSRKERQALHEQRLRENFGMGVETSVGTLIEQCGAVENMREFGIRIVRPDTPTTMMIGQRRHKVKVPRLLKTSRGASFPHIADTVVRKNFTIQGRDLLGAFVVCVCVCVRAWQHAELRCPL